MRFASNRDSVRRGEVSVLAVIETIVATGISFLLAWHFGTIQHVVIASALAPLLLLRTRLSGWYAVWLSNYFGRFARGIVPAHRGDPVLVEYTFSLLSIPVAKLISTVYMTVRRPIYTLSAIPTNFAKNVLAIDLAYSPQFIPGIEETHYQRQFGDAYGVLRALREDWTKVFRHLVRGKRKISCFQMCSC